MDVREHLQVGAHDFGVRRHSHVRLNVGCRLAILILHFEAQDHRRIRSKRGAVAMPYDAGTVAEYINGGVQRGSKRGRFAAAIVAAERCAVYLRQIDRADESPGKSGLADDVGEDRVAARLERWERIDERSIGLARRMQMPDAIERGRAHEEQMHQVAVVGHDTVHDSVLEPILVGRRRAYLKAIAVDENERELGWLEQLGDGGVALGVGIPPRECEIENRRHDYSGYRHRTPSAPPQFRRDRSAGSKTRFAGG